MRGVRRLGVITGWRVTLPDPAVLAHPRNVYSFHASTFKELFISRCCLLLDSSALKLVTSPTRADIDNNVGVETSALLSIASCLSSRTNLISRRNKAEPSAETKKYKMECQKLNLQNSNDCSSWIRITALYLLLICTSQAVEIYCSYDIYIAIKYI